LLASCVEQPSSVCESTSDCDAEHVCDSVTRRCVINFDLARTGVDLWGEFACFEPTTAIDPRGTMSMAVSSSIAAALLVRGPMGEPIPAGFHITERAGCRMTLTASTSIWRLVTAFVRSGTVGEAISVELWIPSSDLDKPTSSGPGGSGLVVVREGTDRLGPRLLPPIDGQAKLIEVDLGAKPKVIRGEFSAERHPE
jgi:hypothetical protein